MLKQNWHKGESVTIGQLPYIEGSMRECFKRIKTKCLNVFAEPLQFYFEDFFEI
ncbi:hypothetical protein SAMN05216556_10512 [Aequorivita viscosa]|uniref:Uncharacterized protein n=1 Tax=Aequorivita viscosa TaxID=797419 RepID=A0A1M6CL52_9FLAO|nr:hypothetical protein SAMN05216556_10512 [Aequorivita viscosa]SHI61653.1 hypothetical protein SAMN04487908_10412 [Aequorivita viscosa]